MNQAKKIGIILLLAGVCLPFLAFPFVDNYSPHEGIVDNIAQMEIVMREQKLIVSGGGLKLQEKSAIQFKYIFTLGVVLILTGTGFIALSKK